MSAVKQPMLGELAVHSLQRDLRRKDADVGVLGVGRVRGQVAPASTIRIDRVRGEDRSE